MTIKTAIQYCVLINGSIPTDKETGTPYISNNFTQIKQGAINARQDIEFADCRIEVARITVIEGV